MKIALAAPTQIPARRANTIQVMKMAQALVQIGHSVRLASPRYVPPETEPGWEELSRLYGLEQRFSVEWLDASRRLRGYDYGWKAMRWAQGWGADLLYTRLPQAAASASLLGMPVVMEVHDLPRGSMGRVAFKAFLRGRGARRLVVISHALVEDLAQMLGARRAAPFTLVLPDGVDLRRFDGLPGPQAARRMLPRIFGEALPAERFTAGYTGHLYAGRGVELILRLAARLPQINFLLAGGEPGDVERVRREAAGLANLHLTGFVPNSELPLFQAACEALLMPYQSRVTASSGGDIARYLSPMKVFEYLACGRAILSSNLPVLCEVLGPGNALLLPPEDENAWTAALLRLQKDPTLREDLAAQARRDSARFSWESRARSIIAGL